MPVRACQTRENGNGPPDQVDDKSMGDHGSESTVPTLEKSFSCGQLPSGETFVQSEPENTGQDGYPDESQPELNSPQCRQTDIARPDTRGDPSETRTDIAQ